ncbi:MAG: DsrE family protein [Helicobacteraceae bacterium]|nr:DsrE family protein [Helicobacteraceae bacterium]
MKKFILLLALFGMLHADDEIAKVVFDLTTGDLQTFEKKVLKGIAVHKAHYEGNLKELEVAVVIHGNAYKFFVKDPKHSPFSSDTKLIEAQPTLQKRITSMAENYDVSFLMCDTGRKSHKLETKDIYDFVTMVPNSTIGLIDKQQEGFSYIPIGD